MDIIAHLLKSERLLLRALQPDLPYSRHLTVAQFERSIDLLLNDYKSAVRLSLLRGNQQLAFLQATMHKFREFSADDYVYPADTYEALEPAGLRVMDIDDFCQKMPNRWLDCVAN